MLVVCSPPRYWCIFWSEVIEYATAAMLPSMPEPPVYMLHAHSIGVLDMLLKQFFMLLFGLFFNYMANHDCDVCGAPLQWLDVHVYCLHVRGYKFRVFGDQVFQVRQIYL